MANEKPETVEVEALQAHSYNGTDYAVGDTYDIAADLVDSVTIQGKAIATDRVTRAKDQAKAAEKSREAAAKAADTAQTPMVTKDITTKRLRRSTAKPTKRRK